MAISLQNISKKYGKADNQISALTDITLSFAAGTFTAIMGPSGSGKSTLLQCAAGLDRPTTGTVTLAGTSLQDKTETELTLLRRQKVGFVFQSFNLLPSLTAEQNVALPLRLAGQKPTQRQILNALAKVGLEDRANHRPSELSGGQQQRVAIARALIVQPAVLFADEPTGALDSTTGHSLLQTLSQLVRENGQTIIMVTHDPIAAAYAQKVVFLADGRLAGELSRPTPEAIAQHMTRLEAKA